METITNLASTAANAASKLVYGEPAATDATNTTNTANTTTAANITRTNETAGREPISGAQGRGTASEPFDQGNAATPLERTSGTGTFLDYKTLGAEGQEPISGVLGKGTATQPYDQGNTANPASTLNQLDSRPTGYDSTPYAGSQTTGYDSTPFAGSQTTGVSDKVWKDTSVDNVSTSVIADAPYDPDTSHVKSAPDHPFEKTGSESLRQSTNPFTTETSNFDPVEKSSFSPISSIPVPIQGSHVDSHEKSTFGSTDKSHSSSTDKAGIPVPVGKTINTPTGSSGLPAVDTPPIEYKYEGSGAPVAQDSGAASSTTGFEKAIQNSAPATTTSTGVAGNNSSHTYGSTASPVSGSSSTANTTGDNHESKMSHMKEKFMDKLHLGHK